MTRPPPTLRVERGLLRSGVAQLACADEVGRGALCGPVCVGVVVVDAGTRPAPSGVRDSKVLTARRRRELVPLIEAWAPHAVGMASAQEIDRWGIVAALQVAGRRALARLGSLPDAVLLDGSHDFLSGVCPVPAPEAQVPVPPVHTRVKADVECAAVAAASILAKEARDALMVELGREFPEFRWDRNKGYGSQEHREALVRFGATRHHRRSWLSRLLPDSS